MKDGVKVKISIKPLGPLFFNGGQFFGIDGDASPWVTSRKMPYPSVIYGALFSLIYQHHSLTSKEIEEIKTRYYGYKKSNYKIYKNAMDEYMKSHLNIGSIFLNDGEENLISAPHDLFIEDNRTIEYGDYKYDDFNNELILCNQSKGKPNKNESWYMDLSQFRASYSFYDRDLRLRESQQIFAYQRKTGLELKNKKTVDGHLYTLDLIKFRSKEYYYEINATMSQEVYKLLGDKALLRGTMKLGGEGYMASYTIGKEENYNIKYYNRYEENIVADRYVRLIAASPMILVDKNNRCLSAPQFKKYKVIASMSDQPIYVGGYDINIRDHKDMYKAMPAGSIFIIDRGEDAKEATLREIREALEDEFKTLLVERYKGFGHYLLAPFKELDRDEQ